MSTGIEKVVFSNADVKDASILVDIYDSAFYDDYILYGYCPAYGRSIEDMEKSVLDFPKIIASVDGNPVGVISYQKQDEGSYYIGCLGVKKEYQGMGIGTKLMTYWMELHSDWRKVALVTPKDHERNIKFYCKRFGFEIVGEEYDEHVTVLQFELKR